MISLLNKRITYLFLAALTIWRVFVAATMQLHPDESYYWMWSKFLDFGYFDHPPFLAYFIKLFTLFSSSELWVRMPAIFTALCMSFAAWKIAMKIYSDERIAALSVFLLNTLPVAMTGSIIITPDVPAFLFWGIGIYLALEVNFSYQEGNGKNILLIWLLLGAAAGLGLVAKYTGVLFFLCMFIYLLMTPNRKLLLTVSPYAGVLTAVLLFLPVVLWNARHEWVSFAFQLRHGLGGNKLNYFNLIEYFGSQLLVAGPFFFLVGMYSSVKGFFSRNSNEKLLSSFSLPLILFFAYASLKRLGEANWPALAYFAFSIIVAAHIVNSGKVLRNMLLALVLLLNVFISLLITAQARFGVLDLKRFSSALAKADATNFFYGYRELGLEIEKYDDISFVITTSHQLCGEIYYYTGGRYPVTTDGSEKRKSQFDIWNFEKDMAGKNGLYVFLNNDYKDLERYKNYFSEIFSKQNLDVVRDGFLVRRYTIVHGRKFESQ